MTKIKSRQYPIDSLLTDCAVILGLCPDIAGWLIANRHSVRPFDIALNKFYHIPL